MRLSLNKRSLCAFTALLVSACSSSQDPIPPRYDARFPNNPDPRPPFVLQDAQSPHLPESAEPVRYDLTLHVDPRKTDFSGKARIDVTLKERTDHLVLHARAMTIESATVDRTTVSVKTRKAFGSQEGNEELVLVFGQTLLPGEHLVEIQYTAPFNGQLRGLYRVEQGGKAWAFTQLEPIDARRMFPAFDEPRFKTPFTLHVEIPEGMKAFSNAASSKETKTEKGVMVDFAPTLPLPTYLVALAVGDLEVTEGQKEPVPIRMITVPGKGAQSGLALEAAADYLKVFGNYFGRPYPYTKLDIVAVPDFGPGAMENAGLVTFREELLLLDPQHAPIWSVRRMESVMAHELAHQWFGDLVTMKWWDDIWLNEGFATWMGTKGVDERNPSFGSYVDLVGHKLNVMTSDAQGSAKPVRIPINTTDAISESSGWTAYIKGQAFLRMLESYVGADTFRDGLRSYVKSHEWGNVTSDDLIAALSKTSGKDLAPIARSFLDQPGVPLVRVGVQCDAKGGHVSLSSEPLVSIASDKDKPRSWTIPVCLKAEGAKEPVCTRLEGKASLDLPQCPAWIYPNASEQGYYRYELPPALLSPLAKASQKSLSSEERAALISNTWALVSSHRASVEAALDMLTSLDLKNDSSRLVLEQTIAVLTTIRDSMVDEKTLPAYRSMVSKLLSPVLKQMDARAKRKDAEDERLSRLAVLGALFDLADDEGVKKAAEKHVLDWLKDPNAVPPDLAALALRISSRTGGAAKEAILWEKLAHAEASDRVALVSALASAKNPETLKKVLKGLVDGQVRAGDFRYIFSAAARQPDSRDILIHWTMEHLPELRTKLGGAAGLVSLIGWTCKKSDYEEVSTFWKERLASLEGAKRAFDESSEAALHCMEIREREAEHLAKWLGSQKR